MSAISKLTDNLAKLSAYQWIALGSAYVWAGYVGRQFIACWSISYFALGLAIILFCTIAVLVIKFSGILFPREKRLYSLCSIVIILALMALSAFGSNAWRQTRSRQESLAHNPKIEIFAERVTRHLLDKSYINFDSYQKSLLNGELSPNTIRNLQAVGELPNSSELSTKSKEFKKERRICVIHIDKIQMMEPTKGGFLPVAVSGRRIGNTADRTHVDNLNFTMHYLIGESSKTNEPIVAEILLPQGGAKHD